MSDWIFRIMMTVMAIVIALQIFVLATTKPKPTMCVNGVIMEQQKDMWVQKGMFATQCMNIDVD